MRRALDHAVAGAWPSREACGSVTLDFDARHRRRIRLVTDTGEAVLLDLAQAVALADGDGLKLDDGGWLAVFAAPEPLMEIMAADARHLARLAWHIGNRHLAAEIADGRIRIRPDHVIAAMIRGLGGSVREVCAPFQPEGGAYGEHTHHHDHAHEPGHAH